MSLETLRIKTLFERITSLEKQIPDLENTLVQYRKNLRNLKRELNQYLKKMSNEEALKFGEETGYLTNEDLTEMRRTIKHLKAVGVDG